ncbi:MAG: isochorismatase family protein [Candidatus Manganitrophus sp.]|nr:isochorismatase family protein [Candidatus Manganitrophus sp.]
MPAENRGSKSLFSRSGAPIYATRDWHPEGHLSFKERGGPWPPHCLQGSKGAEFHPRLVLPKSVTIILKGTDPDREAYSGFQGTDLAERLRKRAGRTALCRRPCHRLLREEHRLGCA